MPDTDTELASMIRLTSAITTFFWCLFLMILCIVIAVACSVWMVRELS